MAKIEEVTYRYTEPTVPFGKQDFEFKYTLKEGDDIDDVIKAMQLATFRALQTKESSAVFYNYIVERKAREAKKKEEVEDVEISKKEDVKGESS